MLHLVNRKELKLEKVITLLTEQPAKILGIDKGTLSTGKDADICIFDENATTSVNKSNMLSTGKNSPFNGWELQGAVTHTIFNGNVVFDKDNIK